MSVCGGCAGTGDEAFEERPFRECRTCYGTGFVAQPGERDEPLLWTASALLHLVADRTMPAALTKACAKVAHDLIAQRAEEDVAEWERRNEP